MRSYHIIIWSEELWPHVRSLPCGESCCVFQAWKTKPLSMNFSWLFQAADTLYNTHKYCTAQTSRRIIFKTFVAQCRDANINIQKIGRIQTKNREVFKITCNFKTGCQIWVSKWTKNVYKNRKPPSEMRRVGISAQCTANCSWSYNMDIILRFSDLIASRRYTSPKLSKELSIILSTVGTVTHIK